MFLVTFCAWEKKKSNEMLVIVKCQWPKGSALLNLICWQGNNCGRSNFNQSIIEYKELLT